VTAENTGREPDYQRLTRNWGELLQEIRVAQTGVQILFAFLLTLPFTARWEAVTTFQRAVFLTTLLLVALASALLIGPVAFHRVVFRRHIRAELVTTANVMALVGLVTLGLALVGVVLLVVSVLMGTLATVLISSVTALMFVVLWGVVPAVALCRREGQGRRGRRSQGGPPEGPDARPEGDGSAAIP
jgi:hypothetical protein